MSPNHAPTRSAAPGPAHAAAGHGERPLPRAFWLHFVLPVGLASLLVGGLGTVLAVHGDRLQAGSAALLIAWPLLCVLAAWGALGAWRSARARVREGGAPLWPLAAQGAVLVVLAAVAAATGTHFVPRITDHATLAQGGDPLGRLQATLSPDGRRLRLEGPLGQGDAQRVQLLLQAAPGVRLVEVQSPGGRMGEAVRIADAVRDRAAQTRAVGPCDNACVLVFLAGSGRQVMPGAQLGFHRLAPPSFNPLFRSYARREQRALWRQAGLPEAFILNALSSPSSAAWRPNRDELVAAGLIGVPQRPLDIELPAADGALPSDYADALSSNRVWQAIEARFPGTIERAAQSMHGAREDQATDDATQVAGQRVMQALVPDLLHHAGPEIRLQFVAMLADQLGSLGTAAADRCQALLAGDAAVMRGMPAAMVHRESTWLIDAAAEPGRGSTPGRRKGLEREVMRRTLGDRAPALLLGLGRPAQAEGRGPRCELATALIGEVLQLPPAERRLALRLMFER